MSTIRNALLTALDATRAVLGPSVMDLRATAVDVVIRTWSGPRRGANSANYSEQVRALPRYTKVRHVTQREIASSGGRFVEGDVVIGPVTPTYGPSTFAPNGGGFDELMLAPPAQEGVEVIYRLSLQAGASGIAGDFELLELQRDSSLHFMLVVGQKRTTPRVAAAPRLP